MDGVRRQAAKLREQVAWQQKVELLSIGKQIKMEAGRRVLGHLGQLGYNGVMIDEADLRLHEQLQDLYQSTKLAKRFQRDIVRGVEGFVAMSGKQMEIARKMAEACCKYGIENQDSSFNLARFVSDFGTSHASMEDHREQMLATLGFQVCEPLLAMIHGSPLEDARYLTHFYNRTRHEFEIQAAEVLRRQTRLKETCVESISKQKNAEKKLIELKASMVSLGREAVAAMISIEDRQQEMTLEKLCVMVEAERSYHRSVVATLEKLRSEVKHSFRAQEESELTLKVDDYVIVRQVSSHGWSEGECNGRGGWFPSAYVEKAEKAPTTEFQTPNHQN